MDLELINIWKNEIAHVEFLEIHLPTIKTMNSILESLPHVIVALNSWYLC
jgi:hypothetical protein